MKPRSPPPLAPSPRYKGDLDAPRDLFAHVVKYQLPPLVVVGADGVHAKKTFRGAPFFTHVTFFVPTIGAAGAGAGAAAGAAASAAAASSALRARLASFLALRNCFCFSFSSIWALSRLAFMARRMDMVAWSSGVGCGARASGQGTAPPIRLGEPPEEEQCGAQLVLSALRAL